MAKYPWVLVYVFGIVLLLGSAEIQADTGSTGIIQATSSASSPSAASQQSNTPASAPSSTTTSGATATATGSSTAAPDGKTGKSTAAAAKSSAITPHDSSTPPPASPGPISNINSTSVQVEPYSGSASLSIPIAVPPGRAGIQPNLAVVYSSSMRQIGNAGVGWTLDLGAIQVSTKKGVPKYDGTDIITMEEAGSTQDLVADPASAGLYHMEVEGAFANIQFVTDHWVLTDKKGIKYYYGNTTDSKQLDPANPTHIFRWALNRVEDLNGNYMTMSYLQDNGQIYPQTISYTGNDQSSLNLSTYAQVTINYVAASAPSTSYISKFLVKTDLRIDHITVSVGANVQSTYNFMYHLSAYSYRDLLQSVQETGADGSSTLPAVSFAYSDTALKGFQEDTSWDLSNVPYFSTYGSRWMDQAIRSADLNGDGYPDLIQDFSDCSSNETNQVFINNKNKGWTAASGWQSNIPGPYAVSPGFLRNCPEIDRDTGLTLLDLDGDGLPDLIQGFRRDLYYGGQYIEYSKTNNGTDSFIEDGSWSLPNDALIDYQLGAPVYDYTVNGATEFGDITGSGYPDIVIARPDWYASFNVYLNNKNFNPTSKGWTPTGQWAVPSGVNFGILASDSNKDNMCTMADVNGDGLSDIVCLRPQQGGTQVYLNTGSGWVLAPEFSNTFNLAGIDGVDAQLIDVTGSGLPAIVSDSKYDLINTGDGWVQDNSWNPANFSFSYPWQFFSDFNGDGMVDCLFSMTALGKHMYVNQGKPADLLVHVDNGIGATTDIVYDSALHYKNTFLPFFIPVVQSTTTSVDAQTYTTSYSYAGGLWDKNYREFDGFQTVTVTDPQGNFVMSTYLQDHWSKGHPLEQDTYDANGNLYSKSVNTWVVQPVVTNATSGQTSNFLYVSRTDNYLYDGNSSAIPKRTAQEFTYGENPQYGDVTQTINDGQVDPTSGQSSDPNKTTTNISYVNNTTNWLIGLPAQTVTQDVNNIILSKTSFYYDLDTTGSVVPSMGRLTSKVDWLGNAQADPKTSYAYDAYGNLQSTIDPNGNATTITYDGTVHMLPVKTTNALNQSVTMTYYGIDGTFLNNGAGLQGLWGQDASKTDANNQTAYTTYDTFGRPITSISPLDTVALPTEQKSYIIEPTFIAVTDTARVANHSSATISTVSYYDGLGRLTETKSLGPNAGQYIASGFTVYDSRGLPVIKYLPFFASNDLNTPDAVADATNAHDPYSQAAYDPMGRVINKINPDGTYSSITYNQWTTATTDENGHMQQSVVDAFGRLVQKQEYMGADGRSPFYPSVPYSLYATTSYNYDPKGNLISVKDAHGNVTGITYDNLGRKIAMNDPDMGKWQYGYDSNSNLIWQQDAKNQVISFKYDALNRLINKTDAITGPIVNLPNLMPQAATFNVNYNFDDTTQSFGIGRLGSVIYDNGSAGFVYDRLGREITSKKTINGINYNVKRQYDALNRLQQLQYPDGSQVGYTYNQAGQVTGVADY